jgi:hypothetical protein
VGRKKIMRTLAVVAVILISNFLVPSTRAGDTIKDKSPDGEFALEITKEDEGWAAAIINVKTKQNVVGLDIYQNFTEDAHLVWSKDSQRVAFFEPDRRGGSTTVYFRKGSSFDEVSLAELDFPDCEDKASEQDSNDKFLKGIESTTKPVKWLSSGELVLEQHFESEMESGATHKCGQTITMGFDSTHKPSIKSANRMAK